MYAEGIDYPGELLTGVYIVSPALPQVSFERELLRRYFDETEQAGFEYAYLQPGMTRVIQAAGRLIRNETDRGVIALLCQRFLAGTVRQPAAAGLVRRMAGAVDCAAIRQRRFASFLAPKLAKKFLRHNEAQALRPRRNGRDAPGKPPDRSRN